MKKYLLLFVAVLCFSISGFSQVFTKNYKITRYNIPIKTTAQDILQDQYGFVWIATANGLWRYDGGSFKNYLKNEVDKTSITDNNISSLYEDSNGDLWVGTYGGGLLKYLRDCDCFERFIHEFDNPNSLSFNEVKVLFETSDGTFFIGTDGGGLNIMDRDRKTFKVFKHNSGNPNSLSHNNVLSLEEKRPGELLVGTWSGLNILDYKTNKVSRVFKDKKRTQTPYFRITKTKKLSKNYRWRITDSNNNSFVNLNMIHDNSGKAWVFNWGRITLYNNFPYGKTEIFLNKWFQKDYAFRNIFVHKKTGNIWVLSLDGTFFRFEEKERVFDSFLTKKRVNNLVRTQDFFWLNVRDSIFIFDKKTNEEIKRFKAGKKDLQITNGFIKDQVSVVDSECFYTYKDNGKLIEKAKRENTNEARSFIHTSKNEIWVGEILGANYYNASPFGLKEKFECNWDDENGIGYFHRCICLFEDSKGSIWFGTTGDGLKRYVPEKNQFQHFRHTIGELNTINNNFISVIYEDKEENLWIGTQAGLSRLSLKDYSVKQYNIGALKDQIINAIQQDQENNFWIGTTNGLIKFNDKTNNIRVLNEEDGLVSNHITGCSLLLENGDLVFGTDKGLMRFNPKKVKSSTKEPQVYLSKLWVNNNLVKPNPNSKYITKNIEVAETLDLDYTDNKFEIAFQAIHFSNNQRCKYAYKLEGYDADWTYVDSKNSKATYTNIPSGKYTFLVKATNEDNIWNQQNKRLAIIVAPPFWDLIWVRILGFVIGVVLMYLIFVWFINKEKAKSKFQLEKERLKQFEEISQMKLRFFTNISHELRTPLTLITAPLNRFSEKGISPDKKVLQMMYRNSNRLLELINQILDFRKLENKQQLKVSEVKDLSLFNNVYDAYAYWAKEKHIDLRKDFTEGKLPQIHFDIEVVQKIVSNLISNAIKYTPDHGEVDFKLGFKDIEINSDGKAVDGSMVIEVVDNGKGIPKEYQEKIFERYFQLDQDAQKSQSSGIGLSLCAELVKLHGGQIVLDSKENEGAHFTVTIPVGLNQLSGEVKEVGAELTETDTDKEIVLIVEDHQDIREYISVELQEDYKVLVAADGKEGVSKAVASIPDVIISDIMMPNIDGIQLAKQLKANDLTSHIPILFLTAKTGTENKLEGLLSGGHDYIQKPFNISEIQLKIKNILKARRDFIKKRKEETIEAQKETPQDNFLIKINNCMDTHLENTEFGVEFLCNELAISRSQLYRKIQSLTGKSIIEYINFYKLSKAMELLKKGDKSVKEIAFSVGYDDSRYFSRVFKNKFGNPPSHYLPKK
ncbi:two-component regulator propeller domain-containing protein [Wenyingzhuangia sp. IMCC45574]